MKSIVATLVSLVSVSFTLAAEKPAAEPAKEVNGLPLVYHENFADGEKALSRFDLLDPTDWKMIKEPGSGNWLLSLFQKPTDKTAKTPVRSPFGRAIVKDLIVGEFVMEVKLKSTVTDYNHRDLCLFFGEKDVSHLYYVHLGKKPDPNCGNIYLVNGAPRKNLLPPQTKGIDWTDAFHTAKVVRKADGAIETYFDGKLWLKVNDKTFMTGRVGVGSFDDSGDFAEITVWGKKAEKK
jgi:hypothetical protein